MRTPGCLRAGEILAPVANRDKGVFRRDTILTGGVAAPRRWGSLAVRRHGGCATQLRSSVGGRAARPAPRRAAGLRLPAGLVGVARRPRPPVGRAAPALVAG